MQTTGNAVARCPVANPAMIFVAWPVSLAKAILRTGEKLVEV